MAVYQFIIELIPEKWVEANKKLDINSFFDDEGFYDLCIAWKNYSLKQDLNSVLSEILPQTKTWHEDLSVWGDKESHDIQVWWDHGNIDSIKIRLDLRKDIEALKEKIVHLAKQLNCCFFLPEERKVVNPDVSLLTSITLNSNAKKFVTDPKGFLNEIDKVKKDS